MKTMVLVVAASTTLFAGAAFAESEGGKGPFDFRSPGVVTVVSADRVKLPPKGQDPFPFRGQEHLVQQSETDAVLAPNGSEGAVQTANSLPAGFSNGTTQYEQHARVLAFLQRDGARQAAVLMAEQKAAANAGRHG